MDSSRRESILSILRKAHSTSASTSAAEGRTVAPLNEDEAIRAIEYIVEEVRRQDEGERLSIKGTRRRDFLVALSKSLESATKGLSEALRTPGLMDTLAWAYGDEEVGDPDLVDWDHVRNLLTAEIERIEALLIWTQKAAEHAGRAIAKHAPTRPSIQSRLVWQLAPLYARVTGRAPGRSINNRLGSATGLFVRFVCSVCAAMGLHADAKRIAEAIKTAQRNPEWARLRQPHRPLAEVFADLADG